MQRTSWTTLEHVSGESGYVGELVQAVQEVVTIVRDHVEQKKYLRNFYDKASR
jgi:vacuolar protein sorting-associated protein 53